MFFTPGISLPFALYAYNHVHHWDKRISCHFFDINKDKLYVYIYILEYLSDDLSKTTYSNSYIHTYMHTVMAVAAMQGAGQRIRSSLEFSSLPKDTSICRPVESNQQPSKNKTLALPTEPQMPHNM